VLVGHAACGGHGRGQTTWTFRICDTTVYGPPFNTHCSGVDDPAAVRISNRSLKFREMSRSVSAARAGNVISLPTPQRFFAVVFAARHR
jgi:hypothetical protein